MPSTSTEVLPPAMAAALSPENIGRRLTLLRESLGLRPSEIADRIGIERTYWTRFEKGHRPVSRETAALLVHHFDVTLDFVFLGDWRGLPLHLAERMRHHPTSTNT